MARTAQSIDSEGLGKFSGLIDAALQEEEQQYTSKDLIHDYYDELKAIIKTKGYERVIKIFADSDIKISRGTLQNYMRLESEKRELLGESGSKKKRAKPKKQVSIALTEPESPSIEELEAPATMNQSIPQHPLEIDSNPASEMDSETPQIKVPTRSNGKAPKLAY